MNSGEWPWSSADDAKLFAGLAFVTIVVPALTFLLLWLGTHWPPGPDNKKD